MLFGKKQPDWKQYPILSTPDDFRSSTARQLLTGYRIEVMELPALYEQLVAGDLSQGSGTDIRLATQTQMVVDASNYLEKCKQLAAGAVLNYEIADRGPYRINVGTIIERTLLGMTYEDTYAVLGRILPPQIHQQVADVYIDNIRKIESTFRYSI